MVATQPIVPAARFTAVLSTAAPEGSFYVSTICSKYWRLWHIKCSSTIWISRPPNFKDLSSRSAPVFILTLSYIAFISAEGVGAGEQRVVHEDCGKAFGKRGGVSIEAEPQRSHERRCGRFDLSLFLGNEPMRALSAEVAIIRIFVDYGRRHCQLAYEQTYIVGAQVRPSLPKAVDRTSYPKKIPA